MTDFGVQNSIFSDKTIWVGRVNKEKTEFLEKENLAGEIFNAVAEHCEEHYNGSMEVRINGKILNISVREDDEDGDS